VIGIIGYGRFGRLMTRYLTADFTVSVYDPAADPERIADAGAWAVSLETACRQAIVILAVPISVLPSLLEQIAPLLQPDTVVMDVCSVKIQPVVWMRRLLPPSVSLLATHPMFGPDSAAESLKGRKIVLCPERISRPRLGRIRKWLEGQGLVVIETSADQHDRQIAVSLALTHFIGRALAAFGAEPLEIDTEGYKRLLHILGVVEHDTWQLFRDMHRYNPYAIDQRRKLLAAMMDIDAQLDEG
jgi:prephenate dehydrogenase